MEELLRITVWMEDVLVGPTNELCKMGAYNLSINEVYVLCTIGGKRV